MAFGFLRGAIRWTSRPGIVTVRVVTSLAGIAAASALLASAARPAPSPASLYHSPWATAFSPDGNSLAVTDATSDTVDLIDTVAGKVVARVPVDEPAGLAWFEVRKLYVAERAAGVIAEIDPVAGRTLRRLKVGSGPQSVALASHHDLLLVTNEFSRTVSILKMPAGKEIARDPCPGQPFELAVTPDEKFALVGNLIPTGDATDPQNSAVVSLIDLATLHHLVDIRLPSGSASLRGVAVSPDGRWGYVVHVLGRFNVPTTRLDGGWINTNAMTILDLPARKVYATVLLDQPQEGSADPWGIVLSRDGSTAWITAAGAHQLLRLDLARLHSLLDGKIPPGSPLLRTSSEFSSPQQSTWLEVYKDPSRRSLLINDLAAMDQAGLIVRTPLPGKGPRGLALSPDGSRLAVPLYFSGKVAFAAANSNRVDSEISLGEEPPPDLIRQGDINFHDATLSSQHWLSCSICHPDGRADGLNWDLLNDGIGNPKNTRSLLQANLRSPMMSMGVRENLHACVFAGYRFIEFREPQRNEVASIEAFIQSMKPRPSPYLLPNGSLSKRAQAGKSLFINPNVGCASCHSGAIHTDQQKHDVGTRDKSDTGSEFVTPTLVEVWRTAPYLHDGRALTIQDAIAALNPKDLHGKTSKLTKEQIDDIAEYVLSL